MDTTLTPAQIRTPNNVWDNGGEASTHDVLGYCKPADLRSLQHKGYLKAPRDGYQRITAKGKDALE